MAHSDKDDRKYTFFIVKDQGDQRFAARPAAHRGKRGLITITDDQDELAGVMAHEIAHITQKHLLRAFEDAQKTSLPIALAMLGALIASSGASGDAAEAVLATGTSLIQQRQINFTRQDEAEADRVGDPDPCARRLRSGCHGGLLWPHGPRPSPGQRRQQLPSLLRYPSGQYLAHQ